MSHTSLGRRLGRLLLGGSARRFEWADKRLTHSRRNQKALPSLETLESRTLLAACLATGAESVLTDKADYAPEEVVGISGDGYGSECEVAVRVTRPDGSVVTGDGSFTPGTDVVNTGADGSLSYFYRLDGVLGTYTIDVVGEGDAVLTTTTFTDAPRGDEDYGSSNFSAYPSQNDDISQFTSITVHGNYVAAGVGLRGLTSANVTIAGIPSGSSISRAYLYWGFLANSEPASLKNLTFAGTAFTGTKTASNQDTCWGLNSSHGYRADVTSKVTGDGTYSITGVASGGNILANGASLVVVYSNSNDPNRTVIFYDGDDVLNRAGTSITNTFGGFVALSPVSAKSTFIVGDGQSFGENLSFSGSAGTLSLNNTIDGTNGQYWDTDSYDVSSKIGSGSSSASATLGIPSTGGDCMMWVAQVLSVSTAEPNVPPTAANDVYAGTEDTTLSVAAPGVLANDTDPNPGTTLTAALVTGPANGTVTLNSNGSFTYNPAANFNGADSFTYRANDGLANSNTATVTINVAEVNDAPTAIADSKTTNEDTVLSFAASDLVGNDLKGPANESSQNLTVASVAATASTHGSVTLTGGTITYTPDSDYNGPASFSYTVQDNGTTNGAADPRTATGTVSVTVKAVNDAPVFGTFATEHSVVKTTRLTFDVTATDVDATTLDYRLVGAPGGTTITKVNDNLATVSWTPDEDDGPATYNFQVVVDDDGNPNPKKSASVGITVHTLAAGIVGNDLLVVGTSGDNDISVDTPNAGSPNDLAVSIGGSPIFAGAVPAGGRVIVKAFNGKNTVTVNASLDAQVYGGNGADELTGGSGNDQIFGGNGPDELSGRGGTNVLDGGNGPDTVVESGDVNFMLDGSTLTGPGTDTLIDIEMASLSGGPGSNTFAFPNWDVTVTVDGEGGSDTVVGPDASNTWLITGINSGELNGTLTFSDVENLVGGNQTDLFKLIAGGSLDGSVAGGAGTAIDTVDFDVVVTVTGSDPTGYSGSATGLGGGFSGINTLVGSGDADTIIGENVASTWSFSDSESYDDGAGHGILTYYGFETAQGGNASDVFNLTAPTTIDLAGGGGGDSFTVAAALAGDIVGEAGNDSVTIAATGSVAGSISGGADSDALTVAGDVTLTSAAANGFSGTNANVTGGFSAIDSLVGNGTLIGLDVDAAWGLGASQTYAVDAGVLTFSGYGTLQGGSGVDTFNITTDTTAALRGGAGQDQFNFSGTAVLTGSIDGESSATLSFAGYSSAVTVSLTNPGSIDGFAGTATGTSGGFDNITVVVGSAAADSLTGANQATTWHLTGANSGDIGGPSAFAFSDFENLTGGHAADTFVVSAAASLAGTLDGGDDTDTIEMTYDADFTLTDTSFSSTGGPTLAIASIELANLTGGAGGNTFAVTGWSGTGTLDGSDGSDSVELTHDADFTLNDASLSAAGGPAFALASVEVASLTGGASGNTFIVTGWTGTGTLDGSDGSDTVELTQDADFTLDDSSLSATGGPALALVSIEIANLTGGEGDNTFTVTGWSGTGSIDGDGGSDTVVLEKDADFTLTDESLVVSDPVSFALAGVEVANLSGGASNNVFAVGTTEVVEGTTTFHPWTGSATLDGKDGTDKLSFGDDSDFTFSSTLITRPGRGDVVPVSVEDIKIQMGPNTTLVDASSYTGELTLDTGESSATVIGGSGQNTFQKTGGGSPTLVGGEESSTNEFVISHFSSVTLVERGGFDTINFSQAGFGINFDLGQSAGQAQFVNPSAASDAAISIFGVFEKVIGSVFSDTFFANPNFDAAGAFIPGSIINAGDGSDVIFLPGLAGTFDLGPGNNFLISTFDTEDLARLTGAFDTEDLAALGGAFDGEDLAAVLGAFDSEDLAAIVGAFDTEDLAALLGAFDGQDLAAVFGALDVQVFGGIGNDTVLFGGLSGTFSLGDGNNAFITTLDAEDIATVIGAFDGEDLAAVFGAFDTEDLAALGGAFDGEDLAAVSGALDGENIADVLGAFDVQVSCGIGNDFVRFGGVSGTFDLGGGSNVFVSTLDGDDLAMVIGAFDGEDIAAVFGALDGESLADIGGAFDGEDIASVLGAFDGEDIAAVLGAFDVQVTGGGGNDYVQFGGVSGTFSLGDGANVFVTTFDTEDLAAVIGAFDGEDLAQIMGAFDGEDLAAVLGAFDGEDIAAVLGAFDGEDIAAVLGAFDINVTAGPGNDFVQFGGVSATISLGGGTNVFNSTLDGEDLATVIGAFDGEDLAQLLGAFDSEDLAFVIGAFDSEDLAALQGAFDSEELALLTGAFDTEDLAAVLGAFDGEDIAAILGAFDVDLTGGAGNDFIHFGGVSGTFQLGDGSNTFVGTMDGEDLAAVIGAFDGEDVAAVLGAFDGEDLAALLGALDSEELAALGGAFDGEDIAAVIGAFDGEDIAAILGAFDVQVTGGSGNDAALFSGVGGQFQLGDGANSFISTMDGEDLAAVLGAFDGEDVAAIVGALDTEDLAPIGGALDGEDIAAVLGAFDGEDVAQILGAFDVQVTTGSGNDAVIFAGAVGSFDLGDGNNTFIATLDSEDVAAVLGGLDGNDLALVLGAFDGEDIAAVLGAFDGEDIAAILGAFDTEDLVQVGGAFDGEDLAAVLGAFDGEDLAQILGAFDVQLTTGNGTDFVQLVGISGTFQLGDGTNTFVSTLDGEDLATVIGAFDGEDLAQILGAFDSEDLAFVLGAFDTEDLAALQGALDTEDLAQLTGSLDGEDIAAVLGAFDGEDLAAVLGAFDVNVTGGVGTDLVRFGGVSGTFDLGDGSNTFASTMDGENLADVIGAFDGEDVATILGAFDGEDLAALLGALDSEELAALGGAFDGEDIAAVLGAFDGEDVAAVLGAFDVQVTGGHGDDAVLFSGVGGTFQLGDGTNSFISTMDGEDLAAVLGAFDGEDVAAILGALDTEDLAAIGGAFDGEDIAAVLGAFDGEDVAAILGAFDVQITTGAGNDVALFAGAVGTFNLGDGNNTFIATLDSEDVAAVLGGLDGEDLAAVLGAFDGEDLAAVLGAFDGEDIAAILGAFDTEDLVQVGGAFDGEDLAAVLGAFDGEDLAQILGAFDIQLTTGGGTDFVQLIGVSGTFDLGGGNDTFVSTLDGEDLATVIGAFDGEDLAAILGAFDSEDLVLIPGSFDSEELALLVGALDSEDLAAIGGAFDSEDLAAVLGAFDGEDLAAVLGAFDVQVTVGLGNDTVVYGGVAGRFDLGPGNNIFVSTNDGEDLALVVGAFDGEDIAAVVGAFDTEDIATVFGSLDAEELAAIGGALDGEDIAAVLGAFDGEDVAAILGAFDLEVTGGAGNDFVQFAGVAGTFQLGDGQNVFVGTSDGEDLALVVGAFDGEDIAAILGAFDSEDLVQLPAAFDGEDLAAVLGAFDGEDIATIIGAFDVSLSGGPGADFIQYGVAAGTFSLGDGENMFVSTLDGEDLATVLGAFDGEDLAAVLGAFDGEDLAAILGAFDGEDLAAVLGAFDGEDVAAILGAFDVSLTAGAGNDSVQFGVATGNFQLGDGANLFVAALDGEDLAQVASAFDGEDLAILLGAFDSEDLAALIGSFDTEDLAALGGALDGEDLAAIIGAFDVVVVTGSGNDAVRGGSMPGLYDLGAGADFFGSTLDGEDIAAIVGAFDSEELANIGGSLDGEEIAAIAGALDADVFTGAGNDVLVAGLVSSFHAGADDDRIVIRGDASILGNISRGTFDGGSGNDSYFFVGNHPGHVSVVESRTQTGTDTLDFSSYTSGDIDLELNEDEHDHDHDHADDEHDDGHEDHDQQLDHGHLWLGLSDGEGLENVIGTEGDDEIEGNAQNNVLMGADMLDGRAANALEWNGRTQVVLLEFDSATGPGEHQYTSAERAAIQSRIEADYSTFHFFFTQDAAVAAAQSNATGGAGEYATLFFNMTPTNGLPGGEASELDFRNLNLSGFAMLQANGIIGAPGQPADTTDNWIALSAKIGAHELGHLCGLRHQDAFGPIGFGLHNPPGPVPYAPDYPGPSAAFETFFHLIGSPASVGSTRFDDVENDLFFGEREAIRLAFAENGTVVSEQSVASHNVVLGGTTRSVRDLGELPGLTVANTVVQGINANKKFAVGAVDVLGSIASAGENDLYSFNGLKGDLINIDVVSASLNRLDGHSNNIDSLVRVLDAAGNQIAYFTSIAFNDDQFEPTDSTILDLTLPADGTYFVEVDTFAYSAGAAQCTANALAALAGEDLARRVDACNDADTGNYELFIYRFDAGNVTDGDDELEGEEGNDVLYGYFGDDELDGDEGNDTLYGGLGDDELKGDDGNDSILGDQGDDEIRAGEGNDFVDAGGGENDVRTDGGNDVIITGIGNDEIRAGDGNDTVNDAGGTNKIWTDGGNDAITTGAGDDEIRAGDGDDTVNDAGGRNKIWTDGGNDVISTGTGDDEIRAGDGNDVVTDLGGNNAIWTDGGDDIINTGGGDDEIRAGDGNDALTDTGGANRVWTDGGNDTITTGGGDDEIRSGDGNDTLVDGGGNNRIWSDGGNDVITVSAGNNYINAGSGNDTVKAGNGNDSILGGDGNDDLIGDTDTKSAAGGNDTIDGGQGDDNIDAGAGRDILCGGDGNDIILGRAGDDVINGDQGHDVLVGGFGADRIMGDAGNDILVAGDFEGTHTGTNLGSLFDNVAWDNFALLRALGTLWAASSIGADADLSQGANDDIIDEGLAGVDVLTGSSGRDWFILQQSIDQITDSLKTISKDGDKITYGA